MITVPASGGKGSGGASQSITTLSTTKKLIALPGIHQGTITNVTFNGVGLTKMVGAATAFNERGEIWYLDNPGAVTGNLVVSSSGGSGVTCGWIMLEGDPKTGAADITATNTGNSSGVSCNITPPNGNSIVISSGYSEANYSATGSGETNIFSRQGQSFENGFGSYNIQSSPVLENMDFTLGFGARWAIACVAISPISQPTVDANALLVAQD